MNRNKRLKVIESVRDWEFVCVWIILNKIKKKINYKGKKNKNDLETTSTHQPQKYRLSWFRQIQVRELTLLYELQQSREGIRSQNVVHR